MLFLVAALMYGLTMSIFWYGTRARIGPMEGTMKKFVLQVVKTIVAVFVRAARLLT